MAHRIFLPRKMVSQRLDTYVQTVTPATAKDNGDLVILGAVAANATFSSLKDFENHATAAVTTIATDNIYVIDNDDVYEDADGNRLPNKTYDRQNLYAPAGVPVRARALMVHDVASWDVACFDATPAAGKWCIPTASDVIWTVSATLPSTSKVIGFIEAIEDNGMNGTNVQTARVRIIAA